MNSIKKDLFISHASEDKDDLVRPLAELLKQYGLDVWYDEFELRVGSSISRSIDKGISNSNFGLLVLSKSFFNKNWTEYELKSLNSYEVENGDILLPIWKDVEFKDVRNFSPYLADKFALSTEKHSIETIALRVIEIVKSDLFSLIHKKIAFQEAMKFAKNTTIQAKNLKPSPIQHPKLNENLISRIRLIRASLWTCYPHSMEFWMDGFQRDLNIESEIRYWEHLSTCYLELLNQHDLSGSYTGKKKNLQKDLFSLLLLMSYQKQDNSNTTFFEQNFIKIAFDVWNQNIPIYDIKEDSPFKEN